MTTLRMADLLSNYQNQDQLPWDQLFAYLRTFEHSKIANLTMLMAQRRLSDDQPIVVTHDTKEVIDGHHRLCILQSMGCLEVEVQEIAAEDVYA